MEYPMSRYRNRCCSNADEVRGTKAWGTSNTYLLNTSRLKPCSWCGKFLCMLPDTKNVCWTTTVDNIILCPPCVKEYALMHLARLDWISLLDAQYGSRSIEPQVKCTKTED